MADTVPRIKRGAPVIPTRRISHCGLFALALSISGPAVCADPQADAVNERLPASMEDREQHWGVDCGEVASQARTGLASGDCPPAELTSQIRLCGFLYQPPGEAPLTTCPDFAAAWKGLSTAANGNCPGEGAQREVILRALTCTGNPPREQD